MHLKKLTLCLTLAMFSLSIQANDVIQKKTSIEKIDLIIDTDVGIDDAMALAYIFQHKSINVTAISIATTGNTSCQQGYNNIKAIVKAFANQDIPVACGQDNPIQGNNKFPQRIIDLMNKHAAIHLEKPNLEAQYGAVELLHRTIKHSKKPVNILALGPHTNLAQLLVKYPDIKNKINHIYAMGGALNVKGNIQHVMPESLATEAEWNIFIDPSAVNTVLSSGVPVTLVPLDITNYAPISVTFYQLLKQNQKTKASQFVAGIFDSNMNFLKSGTWYFWDPMTAVLMLHPELAECLQMKVKIVHKPNASNDGKLIVDEQHGYKTDVCLKLYNKNAFYMEFIHSLNGESTMQYPPG